MVKYRKILLLLLLLGSVVSANSKNADYPLESFSFVEQREKGLVLDVIINNTTKIQLENVPLVGYLQVYSILGVRVTSINLKTCTGGCYLELPRGLYILKAGKVAQKVVVK